MSDILGSITPGTLARGEVRAGESAGQVSVGGLNLQVCLLNSVGTVQSVNMQLTPTLGQSVFSYSMGDRPGQTTVRGKAFELVCDGAGDGFSVVMEFYKSRRAKEAPISVDVSVEKQSIRGYLTDITADKDDPIMKATTFTMTFATLPSLMKG